MLRFPAKWCQSVAVILKMPAAVNIPIPTKKQFVAKQIIHSSLDCWWYSRLFFPLPPTGPKGYSWLEFPMRLIHFEASSFCKEARNDLWWCYGSCTHFYFPFQAQRHHLLTVAFNFPLICCGVLPALLSDLNISGMHQKVFLSYWSFQLLLKFCSFCCTP